MYEEPAAGGNDEAFSPEPDHFAGEQGEWYFDLPNGAWERQEEKNRSLRDSVRGNIRRQDEADASAAKRDPFRKKPGAFSFRDRGDRPAGGESTEAPADTPAFMWGASRADGDGAPVRPAPETAAPAPWGEAPDPAAMARPLAFRRNQPGPEPAPGGETPASWGTPPDEDDTPDLDGDASLVEAMRSWAAGVRPAAAATSEAHDPAAATKPVPQPAAQPGTGKAPAQAPALRLVPHRQQEESADGASASSGGPPTKFDEMFGQAADGGGLVDSMREWAAGPPVTSEREAPTDISELPPEFLKPFEWELEEPAGPVHTGGGYGGAGGAPDMAGSVGHEKDSSLARAAPEVQAADELGFAAPSSGWGPVARTEPEPPADSWAQPPPTTVEEAERRPRRGLFGKIFGRSGDTSPSAHTANAEVQTAPWPQAAEIEPAGAWQPMGADAAANDAPWPAEPIPGSWGEVGSATAAPELEQLASQADDRASAASSRWTPVDAESEASLPPAADSEGAKLHAGLMPVDQPHDEDPWKAVEEADREPAPTDDASGGWNVHEAPAETIAIPPTGHWPPGDQAVEPVVDDDDPWAAFIAEHETEEPLPFVSAATVTPGAPVSWDPSSAPGSESTPGFTAEPRPAQPAATLPEPAGSLFDASDGDEDAPLSRDLWTRAFGTADSAGLGAGEPGEAPSPVAALTTAEEPGLPLPAEGDADASGRPPAWDPATLWARTAPNHGPAKRPASAPGEQGFAWEDEVADGSPQPAASGAPSGGNFVNSDGPWPEAVPAPVEAVEDDPWAAIVAASGYDDRDAGESTVYLGKRPESRVDETPPQITILDRYDAVEPRPEPTSAWTEPPPAPSARAATQPWAKSETADDTLLRAFEAHASQAVVNVPVEPEDDVLEAFEPLLGKHAAELVGEAGTIAVSGPTAPPAWSPTSARDPFAERAVGTSPFAPAAPAPGWSDADLPAFEDMPPPPPGSFLGFGDDAAPAAASSANRSRTLIRELVETGLLALLVFLAVRASFQNFKVDGSSMFPALKDGQFLIVNKLVYSEVDVEKMGRFLPFLDAGASPKRYVFHAPDRGDIIVLIDPRKPDTDLIKRVIGLPGETVEIREGRVYIDGFLLDEPYIKQPWHDNRPKVVIPEGQYFVMGDNRDNSLDSRSAQVGLVPKDLIIGKALLSYWPRAEFGLAPNGSPAVTETPIATAALPTEATPKVAAGP